VTRRGLATLLATVGSAALLSWLALGPLAVSARSSTAPNAPKEPEAPRTRVAPEGNDVAVAPSGPLRVAANEKEAAAAPPPAAPEAQAAVRTPTPRGGILQVESDQPLSIKADELEAVELPNGGRQLLFNRSVSVEQGGLSVRSQRLEANYPPNATQPDRLVASGSVRVRQKTRELSCDQATYHPARERLECTGNATLRDGANRVSGERIEILFSEDRIRVKGGAVVNVAPEKKPSPPSASAEAPAVGAAP
jgi:lipopolysaccharide transport protein LptA